MKFRKVIKEVKCDFVTGVAGEKLGSIHITAKCKNISDLKEMLNFSKEAYKLVSLPVEDAIELISNKP